MIISNGYQELNICTGNHPVTPQHNMGDTQDKIKQDNVQGPRVGASDELVTLEGNIQPG